MTDESTGQTAAGLSTQDTPEGELYYPCLRFLNREAEYLDDRRLEDWLGLLSDDIVYEILIRATRERTAEEFSGESFHVRDDKETLRTRVERLQSEFAWVEHPPTRTRRFISNIRITERDGDDIHVKNNVLLHRSQGDTAKSGFVSGERHDTLRIQDDRLALAYRKVLLTHTRLPFDRMTVLSYP